MHTSGPTIAAAALGLLSALPTIHAAGLYTKSSPVLQVDAKNYKRLVADSNHTTALEFYAPWCGHCQNLKPAYEKAAKNLDGLAHVAAVNCDEDENKPLCGEFGVQGFPTIKIVRPGKRAGKPAVEDYNGPRTAKAIVDAVVDNINNHVKKVTDSNADEWLAKDNETAKAILFTEKGTTSALLRSVAIDFLDVIKIGQVRSKETKLVDTFGIDDFPSLVLLPGGDKPGVLYDGEMKKEAMVKFLSQAGEPNPDPAPAKGAKKDKKEKAAKKEEPEAKTAGTQEEESSTTAPAAAKTPEPAPAIPAITDAAQLTQVCLNPKSGTCILALVPASADEQAAKEAALHSLAEIAGKHAHAQRHLFPFFEVDSAAEDAAELLKSLDLSADKVEIIAVNGKRGWWRRYQSSSSSADSSFGIEAIEAWIDAIRLSEGVKTPLPAGVVKETIGSGTETPSAASSAADAEKTVAEKEPVVEVKIEEVKVEAEPAEEPASTSWQGAEPTPEATEAPEHDRDEL
ncbi:hypothetical protein BX600DRAFT_429729 [Xylariales sp. PMI_506]|nr:hypothetical protein BX600DRAFT_429729 [Xylariales sp. PMI_506]